MTTARGCALGGFSVEYVALIPRLTQLPGDIIGWLSVFAQTFTAALPQDQRATFIDEVQTALRPQLCDAQGRWWADYVRLRFKAIKTV